MKWIKTMDDLRELESGRELPDEMLEQIRGLLEGMHATYGNRDELGGRYSELRPHRLRGCEEGLP